jgi:hypothetical protein
MTSPSDFSLAANPGKLSKPASRVARQDRAMDRITPPKSYIPKLGALVVGVNLTSCGAWCKRHYGVMTPIRPEAEVLGAIRKKYRRSCGDERMLVLK